MTHTMEVVYMMKGSDKPNREQKYEANEKRYGRMDYARCGESGLRLPKVSLGLWHNFGDTGDFENMEKM